MREVSQQDIGNIPLFYQSGDFLGGFSEVEKEKLVWKIKKRFTGKQSAGIQVKEKTTARSISSKYSKAGGQLAYFRAKCSIG